MSDEPKWPREIWMREREDYDQGILSARSAQDEHHDHRYVDADIHHSTAKYWIARAQKAETERDALAEKVRVLTERSDEVESANVALAEKLAGAVALLDDIAKQGRCEFAVVRATLAAIKEGGE